MSGRWIWRAACIVAGLAAALAHPPFGFLPGLLGYAGFLWLIDRADAARPLRSAFLRGWLVGLGYFAVSTWWVGEAFFIDAKEQGWMAPFAVVLMAAGLAVFWAMAALLYRLISARGAARVLVFAGALAAFEWLRGHVFGGFPWDLPGETWKAGSAPSQVASLVGAYGLTWITLAIVAAPGVVNRSRGGMIALALAVAGLAGLYGFGWARLAGGDVHAAPGAPLVRIVQPDTPERADYDAKALADVVHRNLDLTARPAARAPDVVVWSEAGIPAAFDDYLAPGTWTRAAIEAALKPGQTLLAGGYRYQNAPVTPATPDGVAYFNSLIALQRSPQGLVVTATYDKYRLVPFGEYLPLDQVLTPLGIKQLIHVGAGFTAGPPPRPMTPPGLPPLQPLICYESLFPGFTREGARIAHLRPAWIVNVSDDAWFGVTSGPWQHLNLASYRAIEEGLPMVRATPTGISAMIDPFGRVISGKLLGQGAYGVIDAVLPAPLSPTSFDVWGGAPFLGMLLGSLAVSLLRSATLRRNGDV